MARPTIMTAATERGLRLDQADFRVPVGRASHRAAITAPTRPQAPRHITVAWLVDTPGRIQSKNAAVSRPTATSPTSNRRMAASELSIVWIIAGPGRLGQSTDVDRQERVRPVVSLRGRGDAACPNSADRQALFS